MAKFGSLERFNAEMDAFAVNMVQVELVLLQKAVAIEAFTRIVQKTPVDIGRARGGWQMTIGTPSEELTHKINLEGGDAEASSANSAEAEGVAALANLGPFQIVYISNNVPYIIFLEEEGTSDQAPEGMVAETFEEMILLFPGGSQ